MRTALATIAFLLSGFSLPAPVIAQSEFAHPPIPCSNPCVIEFSPGGVVDLFEAEGRQLAADKTQVIVDGPCISACTILVDLARANVCITPPRLVTF